MTNNGQSPRKSFKNRRYLLNLIRSKRAKVTYTCKEPVHVGESCFFPIPLSKKISYFCFQTECWLSRIEVHITRKIIAPCNEKNRNNIKLQHGEWHCIFNQLFCAFLSYSSVDIKFYFQGLWPTGKKIFLQVSCIVFAHKSSSPLLQAPLDTATA